MNYNEIKKGNNSMNAIEKYNLLQNLIDDVFQLTNTYKNNMEYDYLDDFVKLIMVHGLLTQAQVLVRTEILIWNIYNNCTQENDKKGEEIALSGFGDFEKHIMAPCIKDLLDLAKTWEFEDYRARNYQSELKDSMKLLWDI